MKANRKFVEDGEAVSAVIGVILMVAITVAIAATVYVYVSGMTSSEDESKLISAIESSTNVLVVTYKVTDADAGIPWSGVTASWENGSAAIEGSDTTSGNIAVGDYFDVNFTSTGPGTYVADLLYDGNIIWTSPAVVVSS
jgi:FlaG/FlaF family flagellin (archaellin)